MYDPEQHMIIVQPVSAWAKQAEQALGDIEAANGGVPVAKLADAKAIHPQAFGLLIEALVALEPVMGTKVADDLVALAGLVPVDQALG
jgi:hypothetical protein